MKHYLTVLVNGGAESTILLNSLPAFSTGKLTLGRLESNDIVLPYPSVSRSHAVMEFKGNVAELVDSGSLNKLRINGKVVERIRMSNGMRVDIGVEGNLITLLYNAVADPSAEQNQKMTAAPKYEPPGYRPPVNEEALSSAGNKPVHRKKTKSCMGMRFLAMMADTVICLFMVMGVAVVLLFLLNSITSGIKVIVLLTAIISVLVVWLYYALGESGNAKGTMGKMALGLWVVDVNSGEGISFGRATGRFFAKFLSVLILFLGFIPMFGKKQTLHDFLNGTCVVRNPRTGE